MIVAFESPDVIDGGWCFPINVDEQFFGDLIVACGSVVAECVSQPTANKAVGR